MSAVVVENALSFKKPPTVPLRKKQIIVQQVAQDIFRCGVDDPTELRLMKLHVSWATLKSHL